MTEAQIAELEAKLKAAKAENFNLERQLAALRNGGNRLPFMWNGHLAAVVAVGFVGGCLALEAFAITDFGEAAWGLIGLTAGKLYDIAGKVTDYYTAPNPPSS